MSDILRRGRLSEIPDEEVLKYTSSMETDRWIFQADILVDMAHTIMLEEQEIIHEEECTRILEALLKIKEDGIESLSHDYEDIHISLESKLIDMVGEDIGGRMHSGRSRNDEIATCLRIYLRDEITGIMSELINLRTVLLKIASYNVDTVMPGFTHLQHAQPTTFAHHLVAHAESLSRDFDRLFDAFKRINMSPLGSAAFASTGFNLDRTRTQELLGFDGLIENSMDAVSTRDFLVESSSVLSNLMVNLSRIAEEIIIWSSPEFNFMELDDKYASTSSIMPQKKNPDTAELIRGKTGSSIGSLTSLLSIFKALPMSYNRDLQEANPSIVDIVNTTSSSVKIMSGMFEGMQINSEAMLSRAKEGFTTATELADTLVRVTGIPFRTAHQIIGAIAKEPGTPTIEKIDNVSLDVLGKKLSDIGLTEGLVQEALDPVLNIKKRDVIGGPAPDEMLRCINNCKSKLENDEKKLEKVNSNISSSIDNLFELVDGCIKGK